MSVLSTLHQSICQCRNCPLGQPDGVREDGSAFYHVPGEGPVNARIMIVGEAPGAEEELSGRPFVGRSGHLLTEILTAAGLKREEIFITSVCKCRPPKNRNPLRIEIAACLPWLTAQFETIRPCIILSVGNVPSQTLLGLKTGINALRGRFYQFTWNGQIMMLRPLFHPAYLLRNPSRLKDSPWDKMLCDLVEVREFLARQG